MGNHRIPTENELPPVLHVEHEEDLLNADGYKLWQWMNATASGMGAYEILRDEVKRQTEKVCNERYEALNESVDLYQKYTRVLEDRGDRYVEGARDALTKLAESMTHYATPDMKHIVNRSTVETLRDTAYPDRKGAKPKKTLMISGNRVVEWDEHEAIGRVLRQNHRFIPISFNCDERRCIVVRYGNGSITNEHRTLAVTEEDFTALERWVKEIMNWVDQLHNEGVNKNV